MLFIRGLASKLPKLPIKLLSKHHPGVRRIAKSRMSRSGVALCTTNIATPGLDSSSAQLKHISSSGQPFCTDCNATPDLDITTQKSHGSQEILPELRFSVQSCRNRAKTRYQIKIWTKFRSDLEFGDLGYRLRTQFQNWTAVLQRCGLARLVAPSHAKERKSMTGRSSLEDSGITPIFGVPPDLDLRD